MKTYHIKPATDGWVAEEEGTGKVVLDKVDKSQLKKEMIEKARMEDPCKLIIHKEDGSIEEESFYDAKGTNEP